MRSQMTKLKKQLSESQDENQSQNSRVEFLERKSAEANDTVTRLRDEHAKREKLSK
jgi:predicted nuclease with TOPRIM domain